MNHAIRANFLNILEQLGQDCQQAIGHPVNFGLTPGGTTHHYMVPNPSKKQLIAWGGYRTSGAFKYGKNRPCAVVAVDASLLRYSDPAYVGYYIPRAQWGRHNRGEVHIAICQIGDADYALALGALTEAAESLLSGTRYRW